jgi:hypothetical protein
LSAMYRQRTPKAVLPYTSGHSKIIKRNIVLNTLEQVARKSSRTLVEEALSFQLQRFKSGGYPDNILGQAIKELILKFGGSQRRQVGNDQPRWAVIPFAHRGGHRIKKVAAKYGVRVLFSFPDRLSIVASRSTRSPREREAACHESHRRFCACQDSVVYSFPCACGGVYIGQTGRCVNKRLGEHDVAKRGNVADHRVGCEGPIGLEQTSILVRMGDARRREVVEAFCMMKEPNAFSSPSLRLRAGELKKLEAIISYNV